VHHRVRIVVSVSVVWWLVAACGRVAFDAVPDGATSDGMTNDGATSDGAISDLVLHVAFDAADFMRDRARDHALACTTCPVPVAGRIGGAAMFDGTGCVFVTDAIDLRPAEFTVAVWAYASGNNGAAYARPLDGVTSTADAIMLYVGGANDWRVEYQGLDVLTALTPSNNWHHIAATYDGSNLTMFVDGAVADGPSAVGATTYGPDPPRIGCDLDSGVTNLGWGGMLDDVRLYERALDPSEIVQLAN
jgi:hypothetical protein